MTQQLTVATSQEVREVKDLLLQVLDKLDTPAQPEWLLIQDAAKAMRVSESTIRRRIASGKLEARESGKPGKSRKYGQKLSDCAQGVVPRRGLD